MLIPLVCAATLWACVQPLPLVAPSAEEVKAHRLFRMAPLRLSESCAEAGIGSEFLEQLDLSLQVDSNGSPHLSALRLRDTSDRLSSVAFDDKGAPQFAPNAPRITSSCLAAARAMVGQWRYRGFEKSGRRAQASFRETVFVIPAERWRMPRQAFPSISDLRVIRISLTRRVGLFHCRSGPDEYTIDLAGTGAFSIKGVAHIGPQTPRAAPKEMARGAAAPEAVARLIEQFRAADFFSLKPDYISGWTDSPESTLTLDVGDQHATVRNYVGETVGMPLSVSALADAVDQAVGSPQWVGPTACYHPGVLRDFFAALD